MNKKNEIPGTEPARFPEFGGAQGVAKFRESGFQRNPGI